MIQFGRAHKRRKLRERPFSPDWRQILLRNVAYARRLTAEDLAELEGHAQVLLAEKNFEGCAGFRVNDEVRVTIAGQAAVLLLHRVTNYFPDVDSIVIYPSSFQVPVSRTLAAGVVTNGREEHLGEAWARGTVILAWDSAIAGTRGEADGQNVVIHEFAHQLDHEGGVADGVPMLRVLGKEFRKLRRDEAEDRDTVIDPYGAESPAEFFAVVSEAFFELSGELQKKHSELYAALAKYYCQDPAARP